MDQRLRGRTMPKFSKFKIIFVKTSLTRSTSQPSVLPCLFSKCKIMADKKQTSRKFILKFLLLSGDVIFVGICWSTCLALLDFAFFGLLWEKCIVLQTFPPQWPEHLQLLLHPLYWRKQRHLFRLLYRLFSADFFVFETSPHRQVRFGFFTTLLTQSPAKKQ